MKILRLPSYFYPEQVSSSHLSLDLYNAYKEEGFVTELYVPTPSRGVDDNTRKKYSKIKYEEMYDSSVKVHRFSMFREGRNPVLRAFRYSLVILVQFYKGLRAKGIDVISLGSTPPILGITGSLLKKLLSHKYKKNVPFVYTVNDVFPDSMVNAGLTRKGSLLWKIGNCVAKYIYKNADAIVVISKNIKSNLVAKGVPDDKIEVIYNWIDTDEVINIPRKDNCLFDELSLSRDPFYVTYAGNLGAAQGIDTIIQAASLLKDHDDIHFVIFGDGVESEKVKGAAASLNNLSLFPFQPLSKVSQVYSLGDVSVVACKKGIGIGAFPSKTFSILATATPVLLSFDKNTELWDLIKDNDCGYVADADNADALAEQVLNAYNDRALLKIKGNNARDLAVNAFSKTNMTKRHIDMLKRIVYSNN